MECIDIEKSIKNNEQWDEVFAHIQACAACKKKYLTEEPHALLKAYASVEAGNDFWNQQRNSIMAGVHNETRRHAHRWIKYAAAIIVPAALVIFVFEKTKINPVSPPIVLKQPDKPLAVETKKQDVQYPLIDELKNPDARYYKIQLDNKTQLVMIVDAKMDI